MSESPWILLLYSLPTGRGSARVAVWRKLRKSGALPFKTSAYLLPNRPELLERFQWLAQEVNEAGGEATLAIVSELEGLSREDMIRQFNEARAADYEPLSTALSALVSRQRESADDAVQAEVEKLRRRYREIRQVDFFDSAQGGNIEIQLDRAASLIGNRDPEAALQVFSTKEFSSKTWLTRPQPAIDRVGSAWLIRNFIDPQAEFVFANDPGSQPAAIPYDMMGVEFTHHGDDCTFETLLKRFGLVDPGLRKLAERVHDADLEDGKFQTVEAFGLDRIFKGWAKLGVADDEIFARGFPCFDALYAVFKTPSND
ncbi:MAG: chromate resistance protein [Akkermansiaceae bacterium]|nr:chromate resistance protein [Akkermansiaceae bacterium]